MGRFWLTRGAFSIVLLAALLPLVGYAQGPGVAVRGYVRGDCGDKGVVDAVVEIFNLQTGHLKGQSITKSEFGDWIILLSGTPAYYRIVVTLPEDSGAQVVEWAYGGGTQQVIAGAVNDLVWQLGTATPLQWDVRYGVSVYGPVTILADQACASPQANGPSYVYGRMWDTTNGVWYQGMPLYLWRESVGGHLLLAAKSTNRVGMFGFGITPVTANYQLTGLTGGAPVYKSFRVAAEPGKGPMNLGTIGAP